jgi:hypothetical protein
MLVAPSRINSRSAEQRIHRGDDCNGYRAAQHNGQKIDDARILKQVDRPARDVPNGVDGRQGSDHWSDPRGIADTDESVVDDRTYDETEQQRRHRPNPPACVPRG